MTHPLKPCPCCGGKAHITNPPMGDARWIYCDNCGIKVYEWDPINGECRTLPEIIKQWNLRSAEETIEAMAKALEHYQMLHDTGENRITNEGMYAKKALALAKPYRKIQTEDL